MIYFEYENLGKYKRLCDMKQGKSKLVAKFETKFYCSYYSLCLNFLFIHVFFWFCDSLRVSSPCKNQIF